jgi:hypothetical protein
MILMIIMAIWLKEEGRNVKTDERIAATTPPSSFLAAKLIYNPYK